MPQLQTWVEIRCSALKHNYRSLVSLLPNGVQIMPVIKSNAYGHGMLDVANALPAQRRWGFVVAETAEALALRRAFPRERILLLSNFDSKDIPELAAERIDLALYTNAQFPYFQQAKHARVHVKVDTGTTRTGFLWSDLQKVEAFLANHPNVTLAGIFSHLADSESTAKAFTLSQIRRFKAAQGALPKPEIRHIACSAAALRYSEAHFSAVRPGIALYGLWPSVATKQAAHGARLKPVLQWKTRIIQVKQVPAGTTVGYGRTYTFKRKGKVAVLPVGYADGFDRKLGGKAHVLIRGRRAPLRGRVCMNVCMVDVSAVPGARVGDTAVLIGRSGTEEIPAEELAEAAGTIHYEITTRIRESLPRKYV